MDMTMIDVTGIEGATVRDEAVVLGSQELPVTRPAQAHAQTPHAAIGADEIAEQAGTIPWEVLTSISRRVPRFYREP
jgi:alanine racemase